MGKNYYISDCIMVYHEFLAVPDSRGRIKIPEKVIAELEIVPTSTVLRVRVRPAQEEF